MTTPTPHFHAHRRGTLPAGSGVLRHAILTLIVALGLALLPGIGRLPAQAATVGTPVCQAHLNKVEVILDRAQARLEASLKKGLDEECAAMHGQVRAMLEVRNIYRRCISGMDRTDTVSAIEDTIDLTAERIAARCTPRSAETRLD